ncbi:hypothetical protein ACN9ML_29460 [Dyadobacter endophyticus]|uniref:hypothetical protein n=1 Tax=Dyadobacter endophyticus TaxID=1749036 RepID=UPI003CEE5E7B
MEHLIVTRENGVGEACECKSQDLAEVFFVGVCGDLSILSTLKNHCRMQPLDGSGTDLNKYSVKPTTDARHTSNASTPLTESQAEFWYLVESRGYKELAHSPRLVHDLALYHSDVPFNAEEKSALFELKVLWEGFKKMGEKV